MKNAAGWHVHFDPTKVSTLKNQTGQAHWILHETFLQPSRLEITREDGTPVIAVDKRAVMKFDNTARQAHFRRIEPGAELPLFQLRVSEIGGNFQLRWGPYEFNALPAGNYRATVVWESRQTQYVDEQSAQLRTQPGAFVGTVRSSPTLFKLPPS